MTSDVRSACLSSEDLGAFAEGRLGAEERETVIAHLDNCDGCRAEVALLADFVDTDAAPARRWPAWWMAAAVAAVVVVSLLGVFRRSGEDPAAPLIEASAALDHRLIEPRLHGFGWAEYRGSVRASEEDRSPERLQILGAAGEVLQSARGNPTADVEHAAGVASLLIADPAAAIERLRSAAERSQDAAAWSDLAAAHYDLGVRLGRVSQFPEALAAADHALKIDPRLPEALFNRALALERIGLIDDAHAAWKRSLEVDGQSPWSNEARRRLEALPPAGNPPMTFKKALDIADPAELAARFPQEARAFAEVELLGRWSQAFRDHKPAASTPLTQARGIGEALRRRSGETLLREMVRAVDEADGAERARLIDAHHFYRAGRLALSYHDLQAARSLLLKAAEHFGDGPGALTARFYLAIADYEAGNVADADAGLRALDDTLRGRPGFRALQAQTARQWGVIEGSQARWPVALEHYRKAHALFTDLGETTNAAFVDVLIGEAAIMLGRRDEAWEVWARMLRTLSQPGQEERLVSTLAMISRTESMAGRDDAAASVLDLEIAHRSGDDRFRADALFRRAIVSARMQDMVAARKAVEEGAPIASRIRNADVRANMQLAAGIAFANDPQRALGSLSSAIEHYRIKRPLLLPVALRERGRALRALGRIDEATSDLRAAVDAIEQQRGEVEWREVRAAAIDGVQGIYTSLVEVLLDRGDIREAFTVADRAAAHAFYGASAARSSGTIAELQQTIGRDAVIEYLTLPRELLIFVVTADTVSLRRVAIDDLPRRVAALNDAVRNRADVRGASLYPVLIHPIRDLIPGAERLTFVTDATLEPVPFSALFDRDANRWLIEEYAILRAPTALGMTSDAAGEAVPAHDPRVVVIRPPAADLPNAGAEAESIARRYRDSMVIDGASPTAVLAAMESADVIHYAGHTSSSGETGLALGNTVLYGTDLAQLRLREAPLVVLAGCRTSRGAAHGDDVATSLSRAFLLAGAGAVVGTAWDVDDRSSAALFERMHARHAADGDPVAALREAQLAALSNSASQPADWAAAEIIVRSAMTRRKPS